MLCGALWQDRAIGGSDHETVPGEVGMSIIPGHVGMSKEEAVFWTDAMNPNPQTRHMAPHHRSSKPEDPTSSCSNSVPDKIPIISLPDTMIDLASCEAEVPCGQPSPPPNSR